MQKSVSQEINLEMTSSKLKKLHKIENTNLSKNLNLSIAKVINIIIPNMPRK